METDPKVQNEGPGAASSASSSEDSSGSFISDVVGQLENVLTQVNNSNTIPKNDIYSNFKSTLVTPRFSAAAPAVVNGAIQPGMVAGSSP
jgi:hypothetical protein